MVHGDVFRHPTQLALFSALLGTGSQLAVIAAGVLLFAIAGTLVWVLVTKWVDDGGWREALLIAPI